MRLEKRIDDLLLDDDLAVARLHVAERLIILEARRARQDVVGPLRALGEVGIHGHDEVERVGPVAGHVHVGQMLRHDVAAEDGRMAVALLVGHVVDAHFRCGGSPVLRHRPRAKCRGVAVVGLTHVDAHARARLAHIARDGHEHRGGMSGQCQRWSSCRCRPSRAPATRDPRRTPRPGWRCARRECPVISAAQSIRCRASSSTSLSHTVTALRPRT